MTTFILATLLVLLCFLLLGISRLLIGRSTWKLGRCGKPPSQCDRDEVCPLCQKKDKKSHLQK